MFTGLIEEIGVVKAARKLGGATRFTVAGKIVLEDMKIDDSVSLSGACQTVVSIGEGVFDVEAVEETLRKTTLAEFKPGKRINLERAARLGDRLGGHLVQGHVDCAGKVLSIEKLQNSNLIWIAFPKEFDKYAVPVGSICVEGVSLTIAKKEVGKVMLSIIPHTWNKTTLSELSPGAAVNLEFDIIGKYVEKMTKAHFGEPDKSVLEKYIDQPEY